MDRAERALLKSARGFPGFYATHKLLGALYRRTGRMQEALREMTLAENLTFGDRSGIKRARVLLLVQADKPALAVALQKQIIRDNPGKPGPVLDMARLLADMGKVDKALQTLDKAGGAGTILGKSVAAFEKADILMGAGKYFDAMRALEPLVGAAEKELAPYLEQGTRRLALESVAPERARHLRATAATLARALYVTGRCYLEIDDPETGLGFFHDAHQLDPSQVDYVYWGGVACQRMDQFACAAAAWNAILQIQPGNSAAREALDNLPPNPPAP